MTYLNEPLIFTTNWNHKLWCDVFSTFRHNSHKYDVGKLKSIIHRRSDGDHYVTDAEIIYNEPCRLDDLNPLFTYLDMGKPVEYYKEVIRKMYSPEKYDYSKPIFCKLLLKCLDIEMLHEKRKAAGITIPENGIIHPKPAPAPVPQSGSLF